LILANGDIANTLRNRFRPCELVRIDRVDMTVEGDFHAVLLHQRHESAGNRQRGGRSDAFGSHRSCHLEWALQLLIGEVILHIVGECDLLDAGVVVLLADLVEFIHWHGEGQARSSSRVVFGSMWRNQTSVLPSPMLFMVSIAASSEKFWKLYPETPMRTP
jgi:hypothetical protein